MGQRLEVLFEDNHILAVNKPGGILSQGDITGDTSILDEAKEYIKKKYNKPGNAYCGLIQRLDRPASGVLLMAKSSKGLERMNQLMREKKIKKTYWALTEEYVDHDRGTLIDWLWKNEDQKKVHVYQKEKKGAQRSELKYQLLGRIGKNYLLEIDLITGRYHQARAQLASAGMTIAGDVKYGYPKKNKSGKIALHCKRIDFVHPVKQEAIKIEARIPKEPQWQEFRSFQKSV